MQIETTRFGKLEVDDRRIITFPRGLLGFPDHHSFALIQAGEDNYFFWLQSTEDPNLAFVVTDPGIYFKDYQVGLKQETQQDLSLADPADVQVLVICNKVGQHLTGNLQGPLLINTQNCLAQQVVLNEKRWTTRQPLLRLESSLPLAKSA